jgi:crotonobetainyl-CoA:carnitine CoA-transferase CaiB-like acyl-CoA transferase
MGSAHPSIVPYQAFKCKDRDLVVTVGNDQQWKNFCQATGLEGLLTDRRFSTNPLRVRNRQFLIPLLQRMFRRGKVNEWYRVLARANVPAAPVLNVRDVARDSHLRTRRMIMRSDGSTPRLGSPMRFYEAKQKKTTPAPRLGQHTTEILAELAD